jgi:hypothetical protein
MLLRSGKFVAIAVMLLGLVGCAPPRTTVNVIGDKFDKEITLEGIPLHDPNNGTDLFWMLRSFVNPQTHATTHQIYVSWVYPGRSSGRYWASDDTARDLPVNMIRRDSCPFGKCDRTDTLGISVDEATLRRRAPTGFQVKLSAQDGTYGILDITSQMINAQLQAEDQALHAGSVGTAVQAADPQVAKGAKDGAAQLDRYFNARYRVTVAAVSVCGGRIQPTSGVAMMTLSALTPEVRAPMLAAYPWISDDVSATVVAKGSPADQAGLRPGDQIAFINGKAPAKGAAGATSALTLIQASGTNSWHAVIRRNNATQTITVKPTQACNVVLDSKKDKATDISADGQIGSDLTPFIRSEDDEAVILAFALALQISPGSDLNLDKTSLMIVARAGYKVEAVPALWQRLADARTQLAAAHPVTEERLAAMGRDIDALRSETAQR